jgi:Tol biopolymer transport system component
VGGEPEILSEQGGYAPRWSPDGKVLYFPGAAERAGNLWALSLEDRREYPITDLAGRRGSLQYGLATDGKYLYFLWWEDVGDIWVMDVAR